MIRRAPLLLRLLAVLFAVAQAAFPAVASVGDGALATRGGRAEVSVHVEDTRQAQCPFVHPADCGLCAVLSLLPHPQTAASGVVLADPRLPITGARVALRPRLAGRVADARAPPVG